MSNRKTRLIWDALMTKRPDIHTFIDAGPGHPDSEAWYCRKQFPEATILGFEPHPGRYEALLSTYPGVLSPMGLSNVVGTSAGFMGTPAYPRPHSNFKVQLEREAETHLYQETTVETVTLDYLDETQNLDDNVVIWADIEGSEMMMLQGGVHLLQSGRVRFIYLELLAIFPHLKPKMVIQFLKEHGFSLALHPFPEDYIFEKGGS